MTFTRLISVTLFMCRSLLTVDCVLGVFSLYVSEYFAHVAHRDPGMLRTFCHFPRTHCRGKIRIVSFVSSVGNQNHLLIICSGCCWMTLRWHHRLFHEPRENVWCFSGVVLYTGARLQFFSIFRPEWIEQKRGQESSSPGEVNRLINVDISPFCSGSINLKIEACLCTSGQSCSLGVTEWTNQPPILHAPQSHEQTDLSDRFH